jgi:hypothetical protein
MTGEAKRNGPGAAATAHRARVAVFGKPTALTTPKPAYDNSTLLRSKVRA